MTDTTLVEAMDEFREIVTHFQLWLKRHAHLKISVVLLADDFHPSYPSGYMSFAGNRERLQMMLDQVKKEVNNDENR